MLKEFNINETEGKEYFAYGSNMCAEQMSDKHIKEEEKRGK